MKNNRIFLIVRTTLIVLAIAVVLVFFYEDLAFEIVGGIVGAAFTIIIGDVTTCFLLGHEDRKKIRHKDFTYDETFYRKEVKIGNRTTDIWYDAAATGNVHYEITDDPKKYFSLDPVLQVNFPAIMQAHRASFKENSIMIRLDDYQKTANGTVRLFTSRTAYFNDLVSNRAIDYEFGDDMSVRKIFENGRYLTPMNQSKMSNHIGFGALVFYGNSLIFAHRGGNATLSKNKLTESIAVGFSENDLVRAHDKCEVLPESAKKPAAERFPELKEEDLICGVLLVRLSELLRLPLPHIRKLYAENKIKIHTLGFGQLVYTGGKPQFYFAIVIDSDVELTSKEEQKQTKKERRQEKQKQRKQIDYNKRLLYADGIELLKDGEHKIKLHLQGSDKTIKGEAQKSFFINYWHLCAVPRIDGVPEWIYKNE